GKLHKLSENYQFPKDFARFTWSREKRWSRFTDLVPQKEKEAWDLYTELTNWMKKLQKNKKSFGLTHGDFTIMNFRIHENKINIFDFDECLKHWYSYELAVFLHYFGTKEQESKNKIFNNVLNGYKQYK